MSKKYIKPVIIKAPAQPDIIIKLGKNIRDTNNLFAITKLNLSNLIKSNPSLRRHKSGQQLEILAVVFPEIKENSELANLYRSKLQELNRKQDSNLQLFVKELYKVKEKYQIKLIYKQES